MSAPAPMRASKRVRVDGSAESLSFHTNRGLKRAPASSCSGWAASHPLASMEPGAGPGGRWKLPIMLHEPIPPDPQPSQPTNPNQPTWPHETAHPSFLRRAFTDCLHSLLRQGGEGCSQARATGQPLSSTFPLVSTRPKRTLILHPKEGRQMIPGGGCSPEFTAKTTSCGPCKKPGLTAGPWSQAATS